MSETAYAPSAERDRFLRALDADDPAVAAALAVQLTGCSNPLPKLDVRFARIAARKLVRQGGASRDSGERSKARPRRINGLRLLLWRRDGDAVRARQGRRAFRSKSMPTRV